jgi:AcrR family transcriptional regulator
MSDIIATVRIMYFLDQDPEPAPQYEDMPPWHPDDNFDNVERRTLNAAWDMLLRGELRDVSFQELAKISNVTRQGIYHYFKNHDALGAELAVLSAIKLKEECNAALRGSKSVTRYLRAFLAFAERRPNHFALVISRSLPLDRNLASARKDLLDELQVALYRLLRREPSADEIRAMRIQLFGGAAMVAAKHATVSEVITTLVAVLRSWRRARSRRPSTH